jgi:malate dehydrogenase (oxaloacetate-decarboxylating)
VGRPRKETTRRVSCCRAYRITARAAAKALASSLPARDNPKHNLLPPVSALREVAVTVALAVALQAHKEGPITDVPTDQIEQRIRAKVWAPRYLPYRRA